MKNSAATRSAPGVVDLPNGGWIGMSTIPDWVGKKLHWQVGEVVELCVSARTLDSEGIDNIDIGHITRAVVDVLYASVNAQVTILENKKAYHAEL